MKSEKLAWVIHDVDYYETKSRRERRGSPHGLANRIAGGVCYRPGTFRNHSHCAFPVAKPWAHRPNPSPNSTTGAIPRV